MTIINKKLQEGKLQESDEGDFVALPKSAMPV